MEESISLPSCLSASAGLGGRGGRTEARGREGEGIRVRSGQALPEIFLEFTIGVDIDGMGPGGDGGRGVFAKIKARNGHGLLRLPMASAEFAFLVLFEIGAGGDQMKLARPAQKHVIGRKFRAIPKVWIPAFSRADKSTPFPASCMTLPR